MGYMGEGIRFAKWGAVAVGLIILVTMFTVPVFKTVFGTVTVDMATALCSHPVAGPFIPQSTCQFVPLLYYGGIVFALACLVLGLIPEQYLHLHK